ncbi:hypothetical protein [Cupriavidus oxalaticus]|nr:hypothetical protein [Cupriavidus oxalaticus]
MNTSRDRKAVLDAMQGRMALGYRDPDARELAVRQPRIEVSRFASFSGF